MKSVVLFALVIFLTYFVTLMFSGSVFSASLAAPTHLALDEGAVTNGKMYTVRWTAIPGAVRYNYESYHDGQGLQKRWSNQYTNSYVTFYDILDSTYWWRVQAVDSVGNKSDWSSLRKVVVDSASPVATVTTTSSSANSLYNKNPTITGRVTTQEKNLATHTFTIKNPQGITSTIGPITATSNEHSFTLDASAGDGVYEITYVAIDKAGNRSDGVNGATPAKLSVAIDQTAPDAPVLTGSISRTIQPGDVTYNWNPGLASDVETYIYKSFGSQQAAVTLDSSNTVMTRTFQKHEHSFTEASNQDGTVWYRVAAVDKAGNTAWSNEVYSVTIDGTVPGAPNLQITDVLNNDTIGNRNINVTWNKPSEDTTSYVLRYWNNNPESQWKEDVPKTIATTNLVWGGELEGGDGIYKLQVKAIDHVGNESAWSELYTVTLNTAPVVVKRTLPPASPSQPAPAPNEPAESITSSESEVGGESPQRVAQANPPVSATEEVNEDDQGQVFVEESSSSEKVAGGSTTDSQEIKGSEDKTSGFNFVLLAAGVVGVGIILTAWWYGVRRKRRIL